MAKSSKQTVTQTTTPSDYHPGSRQQSFSFSTRLITVIILVWLVLLGGLVYASIVIGQGRLTDAGYQTLSTAASATAASIDAFNQTNLTNIGAQAKWPELVGYLQMLPNQQANNSEEVGLKSILAKLKSQNEAILSYAVLDSQGQNILDTSAKAVGQNESTQIYFSQAMQTGQPYASPVIFDSLTNQAMLYFSSPIRGPGDKVIGILRVRYDAAVLQQLVTQYNQLGGKQSFAILLDENHLRLAEGIQPELTYKLVAPPVSNTRLAELQAGQRLPNWSVSELATNLVDFEQALLNVAVQPHFTVQFSPTSPQISAAVVAKLKTQPWVVVFLQPYNLFQTPIQAQNFAMLFAALLIGLGGAVVFFNTGHFLTQPVLELNKVARQIANGALKLKAPVKYKDEVGQLAEVVNSLARQLSDLQENSEQRMAERTQALESLVGALETSTTISQQIVTILNLDELLERVVKQIKAEFGFYHTQIYLKEEASGDLVAAYGSGEIGQQLKEQGHRLPAGVGIVGMVAGTNKYFLSNNVSTTENFIPHPLLPLTRSELALPLRKGERVLGVLDIQAKRVDRFKPVDAQLLQVIADHTAIAIDNAYLLAQTQVALREVERLNHRLTRESWQESSKELEAPGYRFSHGASGPVTSNTTMLLPQMKEAVISKQLVKQSHPGNGEKPKAEMAVPLTLRGEVIGVLGIKREDTPNWSEEEVAAVEAVANQVALALENARLSKEQEKTIVQLKDIDRLKSEFLTSMSHELRTPLNSIIGFADVLLQGIDGELNDLAMGDIQLIHNSGKHLLALINDILDLSKIEAGKMELVREAVDLHDIINSVLSSSASLVKDKPVRITTDIAETLPLVYADKLRLNQILLNLVSNAAKFTHQGSITLKTVLDDKPNTMRVSVIDTGIGIPANKLGTIFERFRQADSSTTRKYGGTGLGLAICKQLIEMHGGNLQVKSQEGVGSEFYFTIPLADN